ncbi:hypothetical protein like AT3G27880 [Hibiscus trionum]|uniref:Uncharacterized protein n=1 Tax=Hibiscus trionum TaxID=183268 RepID=A0A9W7GZJ8_HIBTR|nr:hypothetical protein like AT3G27880 [Hibiscus trionum]
MIRKLQIQDDSSELSFCPSFSIYSSNNNRLVEIAATVSRDIKSDAAPDDEEFEFASNLCENPETFSSFPIFSHGDGGNDDNGVEEAIRIPLRKLFIGDEDIQSSSSSEADELDGLPTDNYCVWKPKQSAESSPNRCKKSKSTGSSSSKRWRFIKDLLKRSNSDGNVSSSSLFMNFDKNEEKVSEKTAKTRTMMMEKKKSEGDVIKATKMKRAEKSSANEGFNVRNKALKGGDKRRSYLPYRQNLVGIFANRKV